MKVDCWGKIIWSSERGICVICKCPADFFVDFIRGNGIFEKRYCKKHFLKLFPFLDSDLSVG